VPEKVSFGILGLNHWWWAFGCADAIRVNPNAELLAIADLDGERAQRAAKDYGVKKCFIDYEKALKDPEIDAVVITTSTNLHAKVAMRAFESGKDVMLNKPMARTLDEAENILKAAEKAGAKLMTLQCGLNFHPAYRKVKELIDEGVVGKPMVAFAKINVPLPTLWTDQYGYLASWILDPSIVPGGAFMDHLVYHIDLLRWYFGSEVKSIYAEIGNLKYKDLKVEDWGMGLLRFKDDGMASVTDGWTATALEMELQLSGTEGAILFSAPRRPQVGVIGREDYKAWTFFTVEEPPISGPRNLYAGALDYFVECVVEDKMPTVGTGSDGRAALEVSLAGYESAKTGKRVSLGK